MLSASDGGSSLSFGEFFFDMNKPTAFDKQLAALETRANDALELLGDLGPRLFPSADLIKLKNDIDDKLKAIDFYHRRIVWLGASAVLWIFLGALLLALGIKIAGRVALFLAPFSISAFLGGVFFLRKNWKAKSHWLALRDAVLDELLLRSERQKKGAN